MKVLVEVIIISLLILLGWRQSFSEHVRRIVTPQKAVEWGLPPAPATPLPRSARTPAPASTPRDASWMWRRRTLDPPPAH